MIDSFRTMAGGWETEVGGLSPAGWRLDLQLFGGEEKTEEPTPRRREEARKKGQAARSTELNAAMVFLGVVLFLRSGHRAFLDRLTAMGLEIWGGKLGTPTLPQDLLPLVRDSAGFVVQGMLPLVGVAMTVGLAVNFAQVGWLVSFEPLQPKFEKISPVKGMQRILSRRSLVELVKASLKVFLTGVVIFFLVRGKLQQLLLLMYSGSGLQAYGVVSALLLAVAVTVSLVLLGVAVFDYYMQRREFQQQLRMTKEEQKEELRQTEGDPKVRARIRQQQRQVARARMMQQVPQATVVVTNPTHFAVALRYEEKTMSAPVVMAKGVDWLAARIVKEARKHYVPVVQNPPVAQALYYTAEIGREIPSALYHAVAEILVMMYRARASRTR